MGVKWKFPALATVLFALTLAVAGLVAGYVIGGPAWAAAGAAFGAICAVLVEVVAGFAPSSRDDERPRQYELARPDEQSAREQTVGDVAREPADDAALEGPAAWLRPDRKVVEFTGRSSELGALQAWCASEQVCSVRVVVGPGGVGKTRLALRVAEEWAAKGWEWRLVAAAREPVHAVTAARDVTSGPVLLVVDDAETRAGLESLLRAVLSDPGRIRVLLVARSLGEWWDRLSEKSAAWRGLLTEAEPVRLDGPISEDASDTELAAAAVPCFGRVLGVAVPERAEFKLPARRVPVLVLHTAALLAALQFGGQSAVASRVVVAEGVLDELLVREARYWQRAAAAAGLPDDGALLKPAVAATALLGADNMAEAAEVLTRVPELAGNSSAQRRDWARWLYGLYPTGPDGRLGSLQPDLLAERHVVEQLTANPDLARACLCDLAPQQAEHALTVLARGWEHQEDARLIIAAALQADLPNLAVPAARVALQTRSDLGKLLAAALRDVPAPLDALVSIAKALPYPSVVLAEAALAVTWRVRELLPADAEPSTIAEWSDWAGVLLSQLGRPAEALPRAQEAVTIRRELAQASPDRYRPDLARSLDNLGVRFSALGRPAEALPPAQEAVTIHRELAQASPDRYRPDLARSLDNLGVWFSALGRPAEALPPSQEAVTIHRELAQASPDRYRPELAASLTNLGVRFSALGRPAEALPPAQEAVAIRRELAQASPDRYRPDLARSLDNLGVWFSALGRPAEALPPAQEAVAIRRELAQASPDRYRPDLARSLDNLGVWFSALGRPAEALPPAQEAVAIRRELAQASPDRYRPDLARSLDNLGVWFSALGRPAEALPPAQEAVAIRRELAQASPDRYRPDLARSLDNLGVWFSALGRPAEALPAAREAVTILHELAQASPDRYRPDLAAALDNLNTMLSALGRHAGAHATPDGHS